MPPIPYQIFLLVITWLVTLGALVLLWKNYRRTGWEIATYAGVTIGLLALGFTIWALRRGPADIMGIWYVIGMVILALAGVAIFIGIMEFGVLRLVGLFRIGAIARVTYYEGLLEPFTLIVIGSGFGAMAIVARLNFFTYNEDFKMFRDIASSFVFLFALPIVVFASTRVIDDEIENRTMLTLMSKPVSRTQVVLGKYLGVLLLALTVVGALGIMAGMSGYLRFYDDKLIDFRVASGPQEVAQLNYENVKAAMALLPSLTLTFMQVAALGAISVAVSTRFGLAVNVTTVVVIYIAANLARFIGNTSDVPTFLQPVISGITYLLPGLSLLDLNQRLVFGNYMLGKDDWGPGLPSYGLIWNYVGQAAVYSALYISAALSFGVALFRSRELS